MAARAGAVALDHATMIFTRCGGICGDGRQDALIVFTEAVVLIEGNATVAAIGRALAKEVFSASDTIKFTTLASVRDLNTTTKPG